MGIFVHDLLNDSCRIPMESYFGNFDQESLMILPFLLMIRECSRDSLLVNRC